MSEQLTLIEEAFGLTVVEGENLQLTLDGGNGPAGPAGPAGAAGAAGPNTVTTSTSTTLTGYIFGNGTTISGATAAASAATPSTLVVRTSGGAASFTGITNNGALTLSTGTTFSYGAGIAAAHRTALGLGSLATQSGTFSGTSSGTNTGDQDLSGLLPLNSTIIASADSTWTLLEAGIAGGTRIWTDGTTTLSYNDVLGRWELATLGGSYYAEISSSSQQPWLLSGWTVLSGTIEPTFTITPSTLTPVGVVAGTIALATDQQGRVSPADMIGFGSGVFNGLISDINNNGGFLTAGTGGTLPIARGGTGATTAVLARTALGSGATGDELFTAPSPAAARTTLELGSTNTPTFGGLDLLTAGTTTLNVYNSLSGANFERLSFRWASNIARIGTAKGGTGTARDLALETDGTERVRVLSTGSVGIGTTAPTATLHVVKGATPTLTSIFANPAGDVFNQFAASSGTGEYGVWQDALYFQALTSLSNGIRFFIGSTNALQIAAPTGNVGIGTASPSALLDVNSDTVRLRTARTPASATAAGNAGDICWDANYIYVCTATNTWKRTAIATW